MWLDFVQLRHLDEGCYASLGGGTVVVTGEQCVFPRKDHGPRAVFDGIAIHFDAAVVEEDPEAVPETGDIGKLFAEPGLGRDVGALLRQPFGEGLNQGRGACLPLGETQLRRAAVYIGFSDSWRFSGTFLL